MIHDYTGSRNCCNGIGIPLFMKMIRISRAHPNMLNDYIISSHNNSLLIMLMPGDGAVCPAIVTSGFLIIKGLRSRSITPPTSKTIIRGPSSSNAALKVPGPSFSNEVTRIIFPPFPPSVTRAHSMEESTQTDKLLAREWYVFHLNSPELQQYSSIGHTKI